MSEYIYAEAYCLMWYACTCGHRELVWNSRDGVTPFGMLCPSCGNATLNHVDWDLDKRSPKHELNFRQRFWRDGTKEEALIIFSQRMKAFKAAGNTPKEGYEKQVLCDINKSSSVYFPSGWPYLEVNR